MIMEPSLPILLSFNGGYVDTAGYILSLTDRNLRPDCTASVVDGNIREGPVG